MKSSETLALFIRLVTLARDSDDEEHSGLIDAVGELDFDELESVVYVAVGAMATEYADDTAWRERCLAGAEVIEEYEGEGL